MGQWSRSYANLSDVLNKPDIAQKLDMLRENQ